MNIVGRQKNAQSPGSLLRGLLETVFACSNREVLQELQRLQEEHNNAVRQGELPVVHLALCTPAYLPDLVVAVVGFIPDDLGVGLTTTGGHVVHVEEIALAGRLEKIQMQIAAAPKECIS